MNKTDLIRQELLSNGFNPVGHISYESSFGCLPWGGWYAEIGDHEFFLGKIFTEVISNIKSNNLTPVND